MVIHRRLTEPHLHSLPLNINRLTSSLQSVHVTVWEKYSSSLCSKCYKLSPVLFRLWWGWVMCKAEPRLSVVAYRREAHPLSAALRSKALHPRRSGLCETSTYLCDERSARPPLASAHIPARSNARKRQTLLKRCDLVNNIREHRGSYRHNIRLVWDVIN